MDILGEKTKLACWLKELVQCYVIRQWINFKNQYPPKRVNLFCRTSGLWSCITAFAAVVTKSTTTTPQSKMNSSIRSVQADNSSLCMYTTLQRTLFFRIFFSGWDGNPDFLALIDIPHKGERDLNLKYWRPRGGDIQKPQIDPTFIISTDVIDTLKHN